MESRLPPHLLSATEQLDHLDRGQISAVELLESQLDQVERLNDDLNAVVTIDLERATESARIADQRHASGAARLSLGGLSLTIKDSLMTKGCLTTSGATELSDYVPETDADSVARLKAAGASVYAKTNLPRYANDVQSYNSVFGTTNNPWDLSRSPGGSSGGSAVSVAVGFSPIEVGSDIAGSIRNPAGMCGVVGHKPSYGIVSARGQIPGPPGTLTLADLAVVGPLGRKVVDCELALEILVGPDSWHSPAWSIKLPPARSRTPDKLRVAVMSNNPACPVDPQIEAAITAVAEELVVNGATVSFDARPDGFDFAKTERTFWQLLGAALAGSWSLSEIEVMAQRSSVGEDLGGDLGVLGSTQRHREWLTNNERRLQMRARWDEFFNDWDVVLAPVSPTVAIEHDHSSPQSSRRIQVAGQDRPYMDQMSWMGLFGVSYLPATAIPIAMHSSGLPIAMQVVGPFLGDKTALAAASMVESMVSNDFIAPLALP